MLLIKPSAKIICVSHDEPLLAIESAGRKCYKSEDKMSDDGVSFCKARLKQGHYPIFEFVDVIVEIVCDRGVSHEVVRHRLCSYAQESTRYCNYNDQVTFIIPPWVNIEPGEYKYIKPMEAFDNLADYYWITSCWESSNKYQMLLNCGWTPQQARDVLIHSVKTELYWKANLVEWHHIFKLRTSKAAHPQMREIMIPLLNEFKQKIPVVFDDINPE